MMRCPNITIGPAIGSIVGSPTESLGFQLYSMSDAQFLQASIWMAEQWFAFGSFVKYAFENLNVPN